MLPVISGITLMKCQLLTQAGVMTIEHADFEGVERLSAVLGADIVSTFDHPELVQLGECKVVEEIMIGEDKLIKFSGPKSKSACTYVFILALSACSSSSSPSSLWLFPFLVFQDRFAWCEHPCAWRSREVSARRTCCAHSSSEGTSHCLRWWLL